MPEGNLFCLPLEFGASLLLLLEGALQGLHALYKFLLVLRHLLQLPLQVGVLARELVVLQAHGPNDLIPVTEGLKQTVRGTPHNPHPHEESIDAI